MKKNLAIALLGTLCVGASLVINAQAQTKTISVWYLSDNTWTPYFKAITEKFEAANPGIKVELRGYANEPYKTAIQVAIGSNTPPDVFLAGRMNTLVRNGQVADLTAYAKKDAWATGLSQGSIKTFTYDNKIYAAPLTVDSSYFYYNKEIFAKEGLKEPTSLDNMISSCKSLKAKGITPISFGNSERWTGVHYLTILNQKLVPQSTRSRDYLLETPDATLLTHPGYVRAFQLLKDMQNAGCFNDAINAVSPDAARANFFTGKSAMTYCGTWCISTMNANGFAGKYAMFRFPQITGGRGNQNFIIGGYGAIVMSSKSQQKDAAAAFINVAVSSELQSAFADIGRITVRPNTMNPAKTAPELIWAANDIAKSEGTAEWLDSTLEPGAADAYLNTIQEVLNGTKTPQQAMAGIRAQALKVKAQLKK